MCDSVQPHGRQPTRLLCPWDSQGKNTGVGCHFFLQCMKVKSESEVAQSCPTLRDPMDCSPPDSSIHGILQARVLEWGAIASLTTSYGITYLKIYLSKTYNLIFFHSSLPFPSFNTTGIPENILMISSFSYAILIASLLTSFLHLSNLFQRYSEILSQLPYSTIHYTLSKHTVLLLCQMDTI